MGGSIYQLYVASLTGRFSVCMVITALRFACTVLLRSRPSGTHALSSYFHDTAPSHVPCY
jgi:hypothetical protein